jgi:hypothetical protein
MNTPRIIPAGPMGLDDILPLIREVGHLRERGEYATAAELEERIRQPITVAGRTLTAALADRYTWWSGSADDPPSYSTTIMLTATCEQWQVSLSAGGMASVGVGGFGPTIASALSDARDRYQAAIGDTLLRMGGLLREVTP